MFLFGGEEGWECNKGDMWPNFKNFVEEKRVPNF